MLVKWHEGIRHVVVVFIVVVVVVVVVLVVVVEEFLYGAIRTESPTPTTIKSSILTDSA